jgi:hypothetical protein
MRLSPEISLPGGKLLPLTVQYITCRHYWGIQYIGLKRSIPIPGKIQHISATKLSQHILISIH